MENNYDSQILIHADIPLLSAEEVAKTISEVKRKPHMVAICESWSGGTSILATRRPDVIGFHFGPESYKKHLEAANTSDVSVSNLGFVGGSMDLDTNADLIDIFGQGTQFEAIGRALSC